MRIIYNLTLILFFALLVSCGSPSGKSNDEKIGTTGKLPRVAIAGIAIESSTFSPALTQEEAFHAKSGTAVFEYYPFMSSDSINRSRAKWFPTIKGHALPGGTVTREAYESLLVKTLEMLKKEFLFWLGLFS